jgi:hypothetical protein
MTRRLSALRIGNFKAFGDTQRIPLKPITLIFGPNSSGKSSFIHSLALAHEAQFGRDRRAPGGRLDVHHTGIGGSSIDLGGFRQFVHRGQAAKRVEWGAELDVSTLDGRLPQLLAGVKRLTIALEIGIELDDQDRPIVGAGARVESIEISGDDTELLRMSRRRSDGVSNVMRLDRLATEHPVFQGLVKAMVESATTSEQIRPEDQAAAAATIGELLSQLQVRIEHFFPAAVERPDAPEAEARSVPALFPVSKGNRGADIAAAVRSWMPRALNDLVKGLSEVLSEELKKLQYLGPLRSFPPRHLAFAEHEDQNWYAGGGYAWDMVRRDEKVRGAVNAWLGSSRLKTPYHLVVRKFVPFDDLKEPLARALEDQSDEHLNLEDADVDGIWIRDPEEDAAEALKRVGAEISEDIQELSLIDQRTGTRVTHRDVGIGISQVLPVLVAAYGSERKLLAMEQPEIHLHPALQAELGDVFIESALGERQNTFILETHSEHLILRLMRRIRETTAGELSEGQRALKPDDVQVLYVQPLASGARVVELGITPDGEFSTPWPGGFFPERAEELF